MKHLKGTYFLLGLSLWLTTGNAIPVTPERQNRRMEASHPITNDGNTPVVLTANLTAAELRNDSNHPVHLVTKVVIAEGSNAQTSPVLTVIPALTPNGPVQLIAEVPSKRPVQIRADVPAETSVRVTAEVAHDVPVLALVVGHGRARYYNPWKKQSSTPYFFL